MIKKVSDIKRVSKRKESKIRKEFINEKRQKKIMHSVYLRQ